MGIFDNLKDLGAVEEALEGLAKTKAQIEARKAELRNAPRHGESKAEVYMGNVGPTGPIPTSPAQSPTQQMVTTDHLSSASLDEPITWRQLAALMRYIQDRKGAGASISAADILYAIVEERGSFMQLRSELALELEIATPRELSGMRSMLLQLREKK